MANGEPVMAQENVEVLKRALMSACGMVVRYEMISTLEDGHVPSSRVNDLYEQLIDINK
jgi:hypothetical protein